MSVSDVLKQVQVTNGGGPRFTIPLGIVVIALGASQIWTQTQMWETQAKVQGNSEDIAALVASQKDAGARIKLVEDAVLELKAQRDVERSMGSELVRELRNLGEMMKRKAE